MGLPDKDDYSVLGGELNDYQPSEDASTDLPAVADCITRCNVAAMSRTTPRAYVAFTTNGTTCTLTDCDGCWPGGTLGGPNAPTVTRVSTGTYNVVWPTTITDERAVSHNLNLRRGWGNIEAGGWGASVLMLAPNSVQVVTGSMTNGTDEFTATPIVAFVL